LNPGESFQYTFDRAGEYFYNDCTDPRPTGKVVVVPATVVQPGHVAVRSSTLGMRPSTASSAACKASLPRCSDPDRVHVRVTFNRRR
jgi:hypothetical protein